MTSYRHTTLAALALTLTACGLFDPVTPPLAGADAEADARADAGGDAGASPGRCGEDERVVSGACAPCDPGTGRAAGDDPGGGDTRCDPITCAADEYVRDNACVACPPGTTNEEGDFAIGDDTGCAPRLCAEDERVLQSACVACAPGSTNAAGDDATQGDTECDVEACPEDHRVAQNACVPCGLGATRPEGDDPTGADTECADACEGVLGVRCPEFLSGYIKAPNTEAEDQFGFSVAVSGDLLAVGARLEDSAAGAPIAASDNTEPDAGAVYVFRREGDAWEFDALVKARTVEAGDGFGGAVALEEGTLVVGAKFDDAAGTYTSADPSSDGATDSGAVHVFERASPGGQWSQTAFLKGGSGRAGDLFGHAVALQGGVLLVGAPGDDSGGRGTEGTPEDDSVSGSGAAYVFVKAGAAWKFQAYLKATNPGQGDAFGHSVALNKTLAVVGAPLEDSSKVPTDTGATDDSAPDSGAAYVFSREPGAWTVAGYIKPELIDAGDEFGHVVALSDDYVAVGARHESSSSAFSDPDPADDGASRAGAVYTFTRNAPRWEQLAYIKAPNPGANDLFGASLATCGPYLYVGAQGEDGGSALVARDPDDDASSSAGAVYVFRGDDAGWQTVAQVKASNPGSGDLFGFSVACDGRSLAVGASGESSASTTVDVGGEDNAAPGAGAAYVFELP
jgi:hypothetical protein